MDDELVAIRARRTEEIQKQAATAAATAEAKPVNLTSETLAPYLENHPMVLVDVWAAWCGPCRMMEPVIDDLAKELAGRVGVAKIDADRNQEVLQAFGIQGIPSFLFFKDGKFIGKMVGARPKKDFLDVLAKLEAYRPEPDNSVA